MASTTRRRRLRRKRATMPSRGVGGLDAWKRKEGSVRMIGDQDVPVVGQMDTDCPGLIVHKTINKYGDTIPGEWRVTHHQSGQFILKTDTRREARRAVDQLCLEARDCGISWDSPLDEITSNHCLMDSAQAIKDEAMKGEFKGLRKSGDLKLKHCGVPDSEFDPDELERGTDVELEHTDDRATARCIAKAHLVESPFYYQELKKMERRLGRKTPKFVWKKTDAGCAQGGIAEGSSHPCDVVYQNVITGKRVQFVTTRQAIQKMPAKAKSIENIKGRAGVKWDRNL